MGIQRENGYSAAVEAFLVVDGNRYEVAKTAERELVVAEPCELPPGSEAELVVIVDGRRYSRNIVLSDGIANGQCEARFSMATPF